ncbi:MAG TPA: class I SAM-dependent methyltransferase [Thermomicrobiales bacterium]|nr:class I SAM-dependent methyltransferase [Thermomicrobiales bacterium]
MTAIFSAVAADYARCRPSYPDEMFAFLSSLCRGHELAWDCGAGSGQATLPLTRTFRRVIATDQSREMLSRVPQLSSLHLCVATAEHAPLRAETVDLVTVAQALHWFDVHAFYHEVDRVLNRGGVLAVWTYGNQKLEDKQIDAVLERFYHDIVGPYWRPERRHVDAGYRTLPFPFAELETPSFVLEQQWTLSDLLGYIGTWSATQQYRESTGRDPLAAISSQLGGLWGGGPRTVRWPLSIRVGRRPG